MKSKKRETTKTPLMNALNNKKKRAKSLNMKAKKASK